MFEIEAINFIRKTEQPLENIINRTEKQLEDLERITKKSK
jgi:hypothetical protein